jgi:hypothetical protein
MAVMQLRQVIDIVKSNCKPVVTRRCADTIVKQLNDVYDLYGDVFDVVNAVCDHLNIHDDNDDSSSFW